MASHTFPPALANRSGLSGQLSSVLAATLFLLTLYTAYRIVYNLYFHPLSHIPGPFFAKLTHLHHTMRFLRGHEDLSDRALFAKYGPLVRIAPDVLTFATAAWLPLIYHRAAAKGRTYDTYASFGLFGIREHGAHARARRRVAAPFSASNVARMRSTIEGHVDAWVAALGERADAGGVFDFSAWPELLTLDILGELCFGAPFGAVEARRDVHGLAKGFGDALVAVGMLDRWPNVVRYFKCVGVAGWLEPREEVRSGIGVIMRFRTKMFEHRLRHPQVSKPDILNYLLESQTKERAAVGGSPLSNTEIKDNIFLFMIAGTDTTATFVRDLVLHVMRTPGVYARLIASDFTAPSTSPRVYPYLDACLRETLRHANVTINPFARVVSAGGVQLGGHFVPAGTLVAASAQGVNHDTAVWGKNADEFRPERWLGLTHEETVAREKSVFVWGYGARVCLGRPVAEAEMRAVGRAFFEAFEPRLQNPVEPCDMKIYGVRRHKGFMMSLTRRN
ncbi:cytochrome P450 monooxygenase [Geopyxis carbonaria]|nr:cytochrome P450 monooxygenase [Geopyxis carbonaria]